MVAPPDNNVLWAHALHVSHNGSPALTGVSVEARESEILAVSGPRGSGKTSLLHCLSGQLLPQRGEVWFNSTPVHTMSPLVRERLRRERFGWIGPEPDLVAELTAWENVALPLLLRGEPHRAARRAAADWMERLDIGACAGARPHALLQSERQRVAIARALVTGPTVLFADEPTAPLHRAESAHVLRTLTTAARSHGFTVVLATFDPEVAAIADRTVRLLDGRRVNSARVPGPSAAAEPLTAPVPVPVPQPAKAAAAAPAAHSAASPATPPPAAHPAAVPAADAPASATAAVPAATAPASATAAVPATSRTAAHPAAPPATHPATHPAAPPDEPAGASPGVPAPAPEGSACSLSV